MNNKKRKYRSLGENAALNALRTGLSIIFPLITYPYAFRILHATGMGKVSFASSIVSYFSLLAGLGISSYAVREGAKVRENRNDFNHFADEIFSINIVSTIISYLILFTCVALVPKFSSYRLLLIISSLTIIIKTLSVDWINTVYEDFVFITIRTIIAEFLILVLLFLTVKTSEDYYKYAALSISTDLLVCISNMIYCRRYANIKLTRHLNIRKHIRPILTLFANAVATTIYVNSDTTMLGWMVGDYTAGIYSLAVRVYTVIKNMLAAIYSVAIPRISYFAGQHDVNSIKAVYSSIISKVLKILIPASIGLFCISREIVLFMGGQEYIEATVTLQILSISLIGAIFGGMITYCLNIPLGREKTNMEATILSAMINIGLNVFLIPVLKQNGAALTTLISEFFVFFYCISRHQDLKKYIDVKQIRNSLWHSLVGAGLIIVIDLLTHAVFKNIYIIILSTVVLSAFFYFLFLMAVKDNFALEVRKKILFHKKG